MFDIGFAELLLLAVLTLLIVGPDRLPSTVRSIARTLSKIRHNWNSVRREIEKEIGMDEIRREIHNEQVMRDLEKLNKRVSVESLLDERAAADAESRAVEELGRASPSIASETDKSGAESTAASPTPQPEPRKTDE